MATSFLWGPVGTVIHLLTTELNSKADDEACAIGPEVGGVNQAQLCSLYLHLATANFSTIASPYVSVLFFPSTTLASGATYPSYTAGTTGSYKVGLSNYVVANIAIRPTSAAQDEVFFGVPMPLGFFKVALINHAGVALNASGNTLDLYPTPPQY